jgi:hypothetical protein
MVKWHGTCYSKCSKYEEHCMNTSPVNNNRTRIGFHYYPDTTHYRESDLEIWLPELKALGASWLVLQSQVDRAIPEHFIQSLVKAQIEPLVMFDLPIGNPPDCSDLEPLLAAYGHWGVHSVVLFHKPNARSTWPTSSWTQKDLVENFLDRFLPLANCCLQNNLIPTLPPLEPGGNYWDTAFLRSMLETLIRRNQSTLLENLMLTAYAWTHNRPLNWGAGGAERWPESRPYFLPEGAQDQRGFRIFDWYRTITQAVIGKTCPIVLLESGMPDMPIVTATLEENMDRHAAELLALAQLAGGEKVNDPDNPEIQLEALPSDVAACNFWLLAAAPDSPYSNQTWYDEGLQPRPIAQAVKNWRAALPTGKTPHIPDPLPIPVPDLPDMQPEPKMKEGHIIRHYLLLPTYEWGVADWHLDVIRPFVKNHKPTVGFSVEEAAQAGHVTVIGNSQIFPDSLLESWQQAGATVERISGDGTNIATKLKER